MPVHIRRRACRRGGAARAADHAAGRPGRAPPDHLRQHRTGGRRGAGAGRRSRGGDHAAGAGVRRRLQLVIADTPDRPDRGAVGQHRHHGRRQPGARGGRRGVGRRRGQRHRARSGWAGVPVRHPRVGRAPPRCRTSGPTAPKWPTPSPGSGCWTAAAARSAGCRAASSASATAPACSSTPARPDSVPAGAGGRVRAGCVRPQRAAALRRADGRVGRGRRRARPTRASVRAAVLTLRGRKGMVLDAADHDTWSVGSFFTNPVVAPEVYERLAGSAE